MTAGRTGPSGVHRCLQAVVGQAFYRREVAVRDVVRPLETADMISAGVKAQINNRAIPWSEIAAGGMHKIAVKHHHGAGATFGRNDAAVIDEPCDRRVIDRPQRVACGCDVVSGLLAALTMRARNEHERSVELIHVFEKNGDVHRARFGHVVIVELSLL